MSILYINTGTGPNSRDGDPLRVAFNKINSNFSQLNTLILPLWQVTSSTNVQIFSNSISNLRTWTFGVDGVLTLPSTIGDIKRDGVSVLNLNTASIYQLTSSTAVVTLKADGSLTLTNGKFGNPYGDNALNLIGTPNLYGELVSYDQKTAIWTADSVYNRIIGGHVGIGTNLDYATGRNGYQWLFDSFGTVTFPQGGSIESDNYGGEVLRSAPNTGMTLLSTGESNSPWAGMAWSKYPSDVISGTGTQAWTWVDSFGMHVGTYPDPLTAFGHLWQFRMDGNLIFPDGSIQTSGTKDLLGPLQKTPALDAVQLRNSTYVSTTTFRFLTSEVAVQVNWLVCGYGLFNEPIDTVTYDGSYTNITIYDKSHTFEPGQFYYLSANPGIQTVIPANTLGYLHNDGYGILTWETPTVGNTSGPVYQLTSSTAVISLDSSGSLTFPDNSIQTTAWNTSTAVYPSQIVGSSTGPTFQLTSGTSQVTLVTSGGGGLLNLTSSTYIAFNGTQNTQDFFAIGILDGGQENATTSSFVFSAGAPFNITTLDINTTTTTVWQFGTDGSLTLPLESKLNSGGVGVANSAEFGTSVTISTSTVVNSEIYMGSGYGEFRSIYNKIGEIESGLTYAGVEGFNYAQYGDVNFSGMVSQTPHIDSMYTISVSTTTGQISIGFTQDGGTSVSKDWITVLGTLNAYYTVNGIFADTTQTVIAGGDGVLSSIVKLTDSVNITTIDSISTATQTWTFGTDGDLTVARNIKSTGNNLQIETGPASWNFNTGGQLSNNNDGYLSLRGSSLGPTSRIHIRNSDSDPSSDVNIHLQTGGAGNIFELFQLSGGASVPYTSGLRTNSVTAPILIQTNNNSTSTNTWTFGADGGLTFPQGNKFFGNEIMTADYSGDTTIHGNQHITGNLTVDGVFTFTGTATIISVSSATFFGDTHGFGAFYAGVVGYTPLPVTVAQFTADYNDYVQNNFQNLNNGVTASTEWVATADNGNDTNNYIDMGIASSQWNGAQSNSVGTAAEINDSWIYVQGNTSNSVGGNLIVGTIKDGKAIKFLAGSNGASSIVAQFNAGGLVLSTGKAITFPDGTQQTSAVSSSGTVVLETLHVTNVSATNITINGQSITAGVTRITAGTGTQVSTSTGALTIWVDTFNTGTLVTQAVTALSIPYANVSGTPNLSSYATTASVNTLIANSLTNVIKTITAGTGTFVSISGNTATIWVTTASTFNTSTLVAQAVTAQSVGTLTNLIINGQITTPVGSNANLVLNPDGLADVVVTTATQILMWATNTSISTTTGALVVTGGVGVGGTVTANKFVGDGSSLTNVTVTQQANIVGVQPNVTLVAGNYSYLFDNTGTFTMPVNGDIVMTGGGSILSVGGTALIGGYSQVNGYYSSLGIKYAGSGTQYGLTLQPAADNTNAITFLNAAGTNIGAITQTTSTIKFVGDGSGLTNLTGVATKTTGNWTLTTGANTVNFSVPGPGTYTLWVNGNIPNGIVTYTANVVVTNQNVPVLGTSYGWYYAAGNALVLTAIPNQIVGTANNISSAVVSTTAAWTFTFGITNNSGSSQTVSYGYTKLG